MRAISQVEFDVEHFGQEIKSAYQGKKNDKLYRLSNADIFWPQAEPKGNNIATFWIKAGIIYYGKLQHYETLF